MAWDVDIAHLTYHYTRGSSAAIEDVSCRVASGSILAVIGPGGAGKTTLLFALAGILGKQPHAAASGRTRLGPREYFPFPDEPLFPDVGMLLQDPHVLLSGLAETVEEEILFGVRNAGWELPEAVGRIDSVLTELDMAPFRSRRVTSLSEGELQKVALAAVLSVRPSLVLLDEPASSLDGNAHAAVARILRSSRGDTTTIFTDTDLELAFECADNVIVLDGGRCVFYGPFGQFLRQLKEFEDILPIGRWTSALSCMEDPVTEPSARRRCERLMRLA